MSNETKRNVFLQITKENRDLRMYDPEAIEPKELIEQDYQDWIRDYDTALPDNLPVIPKAVAYAVEWFQQNDETIGEVWRNLYEDVDDDWHECPQLREAEEWILDNQNTFSRAWVLGVWRVE